ncbi:hypothetical protein A3A03_00845 [Candidatus Nomurabacteria bacterium RIFCSPLOWO2_01_FULL_40_18]|uniref:HNH nuclease domain-containing protein n=1 Tax=Candidatus Nomurabacteria bacterium RIFCSPLOWO2_01_FULL_40_18 TaxID=1801773 RepID=A0A1F6XI35_9BACT|nr:MAG: hypothetical protein A3A03_00845 [Candidatus Nomurabacteria bacterium RIFCSPLOWO2_01_FULL_40_18]
MSERYITKKVLVLLKERSKNLCECCGTDIVVDKHHIMEFSRGGPNTLDNLLVLCPSCHRQIPVYLSQSQQKKLQEASLFARKEITHNVKTNLNEFIMGSSLYKNVKVILNIDNQNIFTPIQKNDRYYVNIIMLEGFKHQLLVFANRVIFGEDFEIITKGKNLKIFKGGICLYEIFNNEFGTPVINISIESVKYGKINYNNDSTDINGSKMIRETYSECDCAIKIG